MLSAKVRTIYQWLDGIAPFETAESFDNVGLLIGDMEQKVENVLVALDATPAVIDEAISKGVQLIITHHPLMFTPTQSIIENQYEGKMIAALIRNRISLIASHTNLDQTVYSGSARIAERLQLKDITRPDPYLFLGDLPIETDRNGLCTTIQQHLGGPVLAYGSSNCPIKRIAIAGGAYDEGYQAALAHGAQAFLTGEVKHHNALAAVDSGILLLQGGHYQTEFPLVEPLANCLQNEMNALEYKLRVFFSSIHPYR